MGTTCSANGQRQTATLNYEISTMWETKPRTTSQETFPTVTGSGTDHPARYMTVTNPVQILVPQFFISNTRPTLAQGERNFCANITK